MYVNRLENNDFEIELNDGRKVTVPSVAAILIAEEIEKRGHMDIIINYLSETRDMDKAVIRNKLSPATLEDAARLYKKASVDDNSWRENADYAIYTCRNQIDKELNA